MGLASATGSVARKVGASGRDLEPEHRRDGLGLLLIALAVVVAAREWWGMTGAVGTVVHAVVAGTFGKIGYAVPIVLLLFGIRMLRAPKDDPATSRAAVGTTALAFAACGLAHVAAGDPTPPAGAAGMRAAGGSTGRLCESGRSSAVSSTDTSRMVGRFSGGLRSMRITSASSSGRTSGRWACTGSGSLVTCMCMTLTSSGAWNGG